MLMIMLVAADSSNRGSCRIQGCGCLAKLLPGPAASTRMLDTYPTDYRACQTSNHFLQATSRTHPRRMPVMCCFCPNTHNTDIATIMDCLLQSETNQLPSMHLTRTRLICNSCIIKHIPDPAYWGVAYHPFKASSPTRMLCSLCVPSRLLGACILPLYWLHCVGAAAVFPGGPPWMT